MDDNRDPVCMIKHIGYIVMNEEKKDRKMPFGIGIIIIIRGSSHRHHHHHRLL